MSGIFFLVVIAFVASLADAWLFGGGFLVSQDWRAHRGLFTAGVLFFGFLVWLMVLRAGRRNEMARSDEAIVEVRNGNWFVPPLLALVMLLVTAGILLGHTMPKYAHELDRQQEATVPFVVASAPGPERRGCRPTKATNPDFGDVTLCVPDDVASSLTADATVYVSGERTSFGLAPQFFATKAPASEPQAVQAEPEPEPAAQGIGFNVNDILKELGVDTPTDEPATVPPPPPASAEPAPTTIAVPELRLGKDKNR